MTPQSGDWVRSTLVLSLGIFLIVLAILLLVRKVPLSYNVRNLLVRWRITLLTALAFTLVVGVLTALLAFVNGMYKLTEASGQPGNVVVLANGTTDELFSNLGFGETTNLERQAGVLRDRELKSPLCSREVFIVANQPVPVAPGQPERRRFLQVRGIEDARLSSKVHGIELHPGGKWFSDAGVQDLPAKEGTPAQSAIQAVLGEGIARILAEDRMPPPPSHGWLGDTLGSMGDALRKLSGTEEKHPMMAPGDTFELGGRTWIVTGIAQTAGSAFGSEIWAKRSLVGPMFGKDQITTVVLRTKDALAAQALARDIRENYRPAVRAETQKEYYSKLNETNRQFLVAILFVAAIMAVGGIFGVMNTMFAAVAQRTKDIGVLRILGFARSQILISFFLETLVIALVGGALGCALGSLSNGIQVTSILSNGQGGGKTVILKMVVDATILQAGVLFTLVMGTLGGLVPALSAMRLTALESLK